MNSSVMVVINLIIIDAEVVCECGCKCMVSMSRDLWMGIVSVDSLRESSS